jgi:hypothetical protein
MNTSPDLLTNVVNSLSHIIDVMLGMQPYDILAWALLISVVVVLHKWHEDPSSGFNLTDLLCENGKLDSSKFTRTGSWFVMSYGFYLLAKTSPESLIAYAPLYGGIWVSAQALDKWQQNNNVNIGSTHADTQTNTQTNTQTTTTSITLTEQQKDKMKQDTYIEK